MNFKHDKKGFTLIELLVVIAIIGLLATLAVVALGNARQKSRDAKRVSDIKQVQTALELRYVEEDNYPYEGAAGDIALGPGADCISTTLDLTAACAGTTFMGLVPRDPSVSGAASPCAINASATCDYAYNQGTATGGTTYQIYFYLEGNTGGLTGPQVHCATQNGIGNALSGGNAVCP